MVKELALPQGIGNLMSIEVGKGPFVKQPSEAKENSPIKERKPRTLDFFGWDVDGSAVDTMHQFEDIHVAVSVEFYGKHGLTASDARREYRADPNAAGTRFFEDLGKFFNASDKEIQRASKEANKRFSRQRGRAMPYVAGIMAKLKEKGIRQFVCSSANKQGAVRKLEYAGLLQYLDKGTIIGEDSGNPGEVLKKGEPQLRIVAAHYISQGFADDYEDFTSRAAFFGDMKRDMAGMIPCKLRALFAFADVVTLVRDMYEIGARFPQDRFFVLTGNTVPHIPNIVDMINRTEIVNYPPSSDQK